MTEEEKESLKLLAYRIGILEDSIGHLREETKEFGRGLTKQRLDEEKIARLEVNLDRVANAQDVTDRKQDARIKTLEDIVLQSHAVWTECAHDMRTFQRNIVIAVVTGIAGMAGIVGFK